MIPKTNELRSKFTGDEEKDLAMLQRACEEGRDELDLIMKDRKTRGDMSKKCRDSIRDLKALKQAVPAYFRNNRQDLLNYITIFRLTESYVR